MNSLNGATGKGVKVAVIDSGINPESPAARNVKKGIGIGFIDGKTFTYRNITDEIGHGTKICEIITKTLQFLDNVAKGGFN